MDNVTLLALGMAKSMFLFFAFRFNLKDKLERERLEKIENVFAREELYKNRYSRKTDSQ